MSTDLITDTTVPGTSEAPPPSLAAEPSPVVTDLPQWERRSLHPNIVQQCRSLFFRQSFINDYLSCPQMALYRWVLDLEQKPPFLAATLGTAAHEVIFNFHESNRFTNDYIEILGMLEAAFYKQVKKERVMPQIPVGFDTIEEAFASRSDEYVKLLTGYQYHPNNKDFHSTMHEQSFVLEIPGSLNPDGTREPSYLFTGQIDQGGFYTDGNFAIRDMKFKADQFRPSKVELDLNVQATTYSAAIRWGVPACETCRPRHVRDVIENTIVLEYNGPCEECKKKIGTPKWPQRFANFFEFIWMNDFAVHDKDQYEKEIINRDLPKIKNPKGKGPAVYQRTHNPDYDSGYKKGEYVGVGFMRTVRPPSSLKVLMSDILRVCDEIRKATFYRNPGKTCYFPCGFKEQCTKGMELEIQEANLENVSAIGTEEPW